MLPAVSGIHGRGANATMTSSFEAWLIDTAIFRRGHFSVNASVDFTGDSAAPP